VDRADQARQTARDNGTQAAKSDDNAKSADTKSADAKSADKAVDAKSADAKSDDTKAADSKSAGAKDADSKPADANSADANVAVQSADAGSIDSMLTGQTGKVGKKASDSKSVTDGKAAADAKIGEQTAGGDDSKPVSDGKSADGQTPAVAVAFAAPAATPIPTIAPADASALGPVPGAIAASPAEPMAATSAAIVATPKAKPGAAVTLQTGSGKPAETKLSAKAASQPQTDDKPQATTGDADKDAVAQARGEPAAKDHRAAAVEAPGIPVTDTNTAAPKTVADAMQTGALTAPSQNTPAAAATNTAAAPQLAPQAVPVALAGVAIEITANAIAGKNHFEIRLDPPELGRIEVRLDVDRDGNMTARMIADRSDTLDLLRRDASGLERALQDAGLKTADNGLQFSLRDQTMGREQSNTPTPGTAQIIVHDDALPVNDVTQRNYSRLAGLRGGIDIRV